MKNQLFGFWSDLSVFKFEEGTNTGWIQAAPLGSFKHPIHGKIDIDLTRAQRFAEGVNAGVTGQDLDIDYDHKIDRRDAAGWVKQAAVRGGSEGLWLLVEWTNEAATKIRDKAYRYFSPEIHSFFDHPVTGQRIRDVLRGGALTNRPFLKGILPINLHEITQDPGGPDMDRALLEATATKHKVKFDSKTSDEDLSVLVLAAVTAEDKPAEDPKPDDKPNDKPADKVDDKKDGNKEEELVASALSELLLAEAAKNPLVKHLMEVNAANEKRLSDLEAKDRVGSVKMQLAELRTNQGVALSPAVETKLTETLADADPAVQAGVFEVMKLTLGKGGIVQLGEVGHTGNHGGDGNGSEDKEAVTLFMSEVQKLTGGEQKLDDADAYTLAASNNPELYERYRKSSYAWEG